MAGSSSVGRKFKSYRGHHLSLLVATRELSAAIAGKGETVEMIRARGACFERGNGRAL